MLPWNSEDFEEQSIKCFFVWLNAHFFFDLPPHPSIPFCSIKLSTCFFPHFSCVCVSFLDSFCDCIALISGGLESWCIDVCLQVEESTPTCWGFLVECRGLCWWPGHASCIRMLWQPLWSTSFFWSFPSGEYPHPPSHLQILAEI